MSTPDNNINELVVQYKEEKRRLNVIFKHQEVVDLLGQLRMDPCIEIHGAEKIQSRLQELIQRLHGHHREVPGIMQQQDMMRDLRATCRGIFEQIGDWADESMAAALDNVIKGPILVERDKLAKKTEDLANRLNMLIDSCDEAPRVYLELQNQVEIVAFACTWDNWTESTLEKMTGFVIAIEADLMDLGEKVMAGEAIEDLQAIVDDSKNQGVSAIAV